MRKHINNLFSQFKEKPIHFCGIGGIGMSGIAEILHNLGFTIQGSDLSENGNTTRLRDLGVKIYLSQQASNLDKISLFVKSTAIAKDNPEFIEAVNKKIPIITRTEMLAELMRLKTSIAISGTHGKTTTTSLIAEIFENAGFNPTVINGGIINNRGTNAYLGEGEYLIAEADESDETFVKIPSTIGVITNIDPEHLDHYQTFDNLKLAFEKFISNLPFYGFGVLCLDHPETLKLANQIKNRKVLTYSIKSPDADIYAYNIRKQGLDTFFDVKISDKVNSSYKEVKNIKFPVAGEHNISNSLAGIAIASELDIAMDTVRNSFENFKGVKRRFTVTGQHDGYTIIDDYAHHPVEIVATLNTARDVINANKKGKIVAFFQPHRYSRTKNLLNDFLKCFKEADIVYIADIYAASESPIANINKETLVNAMKQSNTHKDPRILNSPDDIPAIVKEIANDGDLLLFMGAGSITNWANKLPDQLKEDA